MPLGVVVCVAGMLGGGSVRRRNRELGVSRGEGLRQGSRGGRMDNQLALLLPGPGAQGGTCASEDTQHRISVCLDQVDGSCFLSSSSWLGPCACPMALAELSAVKSTIIQGCSRCFLSVSAMNGEAPGPEMASHTHSPTQGLGRTPQMLVFLHFAEVSLL